MSATQPGGTPPVAPVLEQVDARLLTTPATPFIALHAAIGHAGNADRRALESLARHCRESPEPAMSATVATVCDAMACVLDQEYAAAAALLQDTMPRIDALGGSAAQREVLEETLIDCLVHDGQIEAAGLLLDRRLDRRPSPLDGRRREGLTTSLLTG